MAMSLEEGNRKNTRDHYSIEIARIRGKCSPEQFSLLKTERERFALGKEVTTLSERVLCFLTNYEGMPALRSEREAMLREYQQQYEDFLARQGGK